MARTPEQEALRMRRVELERNIKGSTIGKGKSGTPPVPKKAVTDSRPWWVKAVDALGGDPEGKNRK